MKFEQEVKSKVAGLLKDLLGDPSPENFETVLSQLTRMAILGTAPPSSAQARSSQDRAGNTETVGFTSDDFSASKENFIAP